MSHPRNALPDSNRDPFESLASLIDGLLHYTLTPLEEDLMRLEFGLDDGNSRTMEEIAEELGLNKEKVFALRASALAKLQKQPLKA